MYEIRLEKKKIIFPVKRIEGKQSWGIINWAFLTFVGLVSLFYP